MDKSGMGKRKATAGVIDPGTIEFSGAWRRVTRAARPASLRFPTT
jgi:hypothetical protein